MPRGRILKRLLSEFSEFVEALLYQCGVTLVQYVRKVDGMMKRLVSNKWYIVTLS